MSKLEQLAAYLPYQLMCMVDGKKAKMDSVYYDGTCTFCSLVECEKDFKSIKPILKPLKDIDWQTFINENHRLMSDAIHDFIDYFVSDAANYDAAILSAPYPVLKWCLENHYDVFSLLDIGEAVQHEADKSLEFLDFNSNIKAGQEAIELLKELRGFAPYCTDHRQRVDDILSKVSVDMEVSQNEA